MTTLNLEDNTRVALRTRRLSWLVYADRYVVKIAGSTGKDIQGTGDTVTTAWNNAVNAAERAGTDIKAHMPWDTSKFNSSQDVEKEFALLGLFLVVVIAAMIFYVCQ